MRVTIGKLLATSLLTLCLGLQMLEATGRWDRAIQDTDDEAALVTIVLCVGTALLFARAMRVRMAPPSHRSSIVVVRATPVPRTSLKPSAPLRARPPGSLRI